MISGGRQGLGSLHEHINYEQNFDIQQFKHT